MQEQLTQLYRSRLAHASIVPQLAHRLSCPLMISVPHGWEAASKKVMVVGQETLGWDLQADEAAGAASKEIKSYDDVLNSPDVYGAVDALIGKYEVFLSGKGWQNRPFWNAFEAVRTLPVEGMALWSNIFRFDLDRGPTIKASPRELLEIYALQSGILKQEIEILRPSAVIFFTGPNYDDALNQEFPDAKRIEIAELPIRGFARVASAFLPDKSYRLYHPAYLWRAHLREWLKKLEQLVAEVGST